MTVITSLLEDLPSEPQFRTLAEKKKKKQTWMLSCSQIFKISLKFIWVYLHAPDQRYQPNRELERKTWPSTLQQEGADQKQAQKHYFHFRKIYLQTEIAEEK